MPLLMLILELEREYKKAYLIRNKKVVSLLQKKKKTINLLTFLAIAGSGLHLLVLLILIIQGIKIRQLSLRQPPNFVELINGKRIAIQDNLDRDPEDIREFVRKTMTLMFNWSGVLSPQTLEEVTQPKKDQGILIPTPQGGNQKVTTSSWIASFALSEDFRKGFLREIAAITPLEVFAGSPAQKISAQLMIKRINPPELITAGKWRVTIVADLIQTKLADGRRIIIPFNKDLLVRAVDYFPYTSINDLTNLQKAIYSTRAAQLEVYEIRNLSLLDN